MPDYETRRRAVDEVAKRIKEHSKTPITSDQAHREAAKIARKTDAQNEGK